MMPNAYSSKRDDIPRPSTEEVEKYLSRWDVLENYALQESALNKLFAHTYPKNTDLDDVAVKAAALNAFYGTNIFDIFRVARHILALDIDKRLHSGDAQLVADIADVQMANGKHKRFYSFASKYCSHHNPNDYPIYDSYVDRLLRYFRDVDTFSKFKNDELKNYAAFKRILLTFRETYQLEQYTIKQIDQYLWQLGKEKFPIKY